MSNTLSLLIRDGVKTDIERCLALDHTYHTEYVWQMRSSQESDHHQITFVRERLPHQITLEYPHNESRLQAALSSQHGFVVAANRDDDEILGYLSLHNDPVYRIAYLQDIVVSQPYRNKRIGMRLINVARQWSREHQLMILTVEVQTKNYPGIAFCQQSGLTFSGYSDHHFLNQDIAVFFSQSLR
ncbi:MAG: GNAT family N-acetyltransferase [Anaerolineae bacterium]|nr:GNAT family N-acetyltransferase [Anaerolineae bacterium]